MENSEISEDHLKAIVGWRQVDEGVRFGVVPICRHAKPRAKRKRRKSDLEACSSWRRVLIAWTYKVAAGNHGGARHFGCGDQEAGLRVA